MTGFLTWLVTWRQANAQIAKLRFDAQAAREAALSAESKALSELNVELRGALRAELVNVRLRLAESEKKLDDLQQIVEHLEQENLILRRILREHDIPIPERPFSVTPVKAHVVVEMSEPVSNGTKEA